MGTRSPIEFADIFLAKQGETVAIAHTYSDESGLFTFSATEDGNYTLTVRFIGL